MTNIWMCTFYKGVIDIRRLVDGEKVILHDNVLKGYPPCSLKC